MNSSRVPMYVVFIILFVIAFIIVAKRDREKYATPTPPVTVQASTSPEPVPFYPSEGKE